MMKVTSGGFAVAEAVKLCKPDVLAMYPITPSTFIPEKLAEFKANGEIDSELILVESEFSAMSALIGSSATGVRSFTATSSQGLALMHELLFIAPGMKLPIVMAVANRALSAPLNIWNDQQDSISQRDAGWIQLYVENNQEAVDTMIQAFKIAEETSIPTMMCMDGFFLTHTYEPVDMPESVDAFLPKYKPKLTLDPENPVTQGAWMNQKDYQPYRQELAKALDDSKVSIAKAHDEYARIFGRKYGDGLTESYGSSDTVFVSMGSVCGNLKEAADKSGFEVLRIRCFRPFPKEEIAKKLKGKKHIVVLEKDVSLGSGGAVFLEVKSALENCEAKIVNVITGLGGKDVKVDDVAKILEKSKSLKAGETMWY